MPAAMENFVGTHPRQLDERGRFVLPAKLRDKLSGTVYITRSLVDRDCLILYPEEEWQTLSEQIRSLPTTTNSAARDFVSVVFGGAGECELDKQSRVVIPSNLIADTGMGKDIVLVGVGAKIEIRDAAKHEAKQKMLDYNAILEGISQFGLNI